MRLDGCERGAEAAPPALELNRTTDELALAVSGVSALEGPEFENWFGGWRSSIIMSNMTSMLQSTVVRVLVLVRIEIQRLSVLRNVLILV